MRSPAPTGLQFVIWGFDECLPLYIALFPLVNPFARHAREDELQYSRHFPPYRLQAFSRLSQKGNDR